MTLPATEQHVKYARMPTAKGLQTLRARLFLPQAAPAPHPLLIWLHSGGFHSGSIAHKAHGIIGQDMARHGYATAFVEYRLRTPPEKLSEQSKDLLADLADDTEMYDFGLNPFFTGSAAISAVEDCIVFFQWLDRFRDSHGIGRHVAMGGSSAGAITVLNTLFLPPHLGIKLPRISSAFVFSGAFAYPSFYEPNKTRILAFHSANDARVPIASIRHFSIDAARQCTFVEEPKNLHGDPRLTPDETLQTAVARLVAFDKSGKLGLPVPQVVLPTET